jgi:hypothetical protein
VVVGQDKNIAEQFAHRAGLDLAAVRRPGDAALVVPIGEEFAVRRMLHRLVCPGGGLGGDNCVLLSRIRIAVSVVPRRRCSVYARARLVPVSQVFPRVNVKLRMCFK